MAGEKRRRTRKKKRMPASLRIGVLVTVLVLIVAAAGVMMAPVFNITEVYCEGCNNVKNEDIIAAAQIENGTHILLSNIGKAKRQVENNPLVKEASVRRVFPDKICITVTERIPAGYVMRGTECNIIDSEGVVLEVINDSRATMIVEEYTPEPKEENKEENKEDSESKDSKEKKAEEDEEKSDSEHTEDTENTENSENTEQITKPYAVPLVAGFECEATEVGDNLKATDKGKFNKAVEILNALRNAQLLDRTTYVDVTEMADIRVIVENRLDIYIGAGDNIDYRTKFLSEVINTKISAYEKVVMDYRGDDIFVRPPEDGKDRIYKEKEESEDDKETDSNSEEKDEDKEKSDKEDKEEKKSDDSDEEKSEKSSDDEKSDEDGDKKDEENEEDNAEKLQSNMSLDE